MISRTRWLGAVCINRQETVHKNNLKLKKTGKSALVHLHHSTTHDEQFNKDKETDKVRKQYLSVSKHQKNHEIRLDST